MYAMTFFRRWMLAIADQALRLAGLEPVYEVRIRLLNQRRDTPGALLKRFDRLTRDVVDRQRSAAVGLRADLAVVVDMNVRVHAQPGYVIQASPGIWKPSRFVRKISARAAGTAITQETADDGKATRSDDPHGSHADADQRLNSGGNAAN
jgi:hypothetical protein